MENFETDEMRKIMIENNDDGIGIIQHQLEMLKMLKLNENEMIISKINTINGEEVEKRMNIFMHIGEYYDI